MHLQIDTDLIIPTAIQHMSSSQSMQPNINRFWPGIFQVDVKQLFTRSQNWINWGIGFKLRTELIEMHKISKDFCNFPTFQCEQLLERFTVVSLSVRLWKRISFWHLNSPTRFKCYNSAQFMSAVVIDYLKIIAIPRRPNLILFNHLNPAFQICTTARKRKTCRLYKTGCYTVVAFIDITILLVLCCSFVAQAPHDLKHSLGVKFIEPVLVH